MEELEYTSTLREDLYMRLPVEGILIPVLVQPSEIQDQPPGGEVIAVAVWDLHRAAGSFIRNEVRAPTGVAKGSDKGKRLRHTTVG